MPAASRWLSVVVAVTATASVAGLASGVAWPLELVAALRPHYAVVAAACALGLALARRWAWAVAAIAVAGINAAVLAPLWLDAPTAPAAGSPTFTVLWHNLHDVRADRAPDVVEAVLDADADLVLLSQVEPRLVAALRSADGLPHEVVHDARGRIVALARTAVRDVGPLRPLPAGSRHAAVTLRVDLGDQATLDVLGLHARSPRSPRGAAVRDGELAAAAAWAVDAAGPAIVIGDLNVTPWARPFLDLADVGGLRDSSRGHGLQPTWPAAAPTFPIDHALHGPALTVLARTTGPSLGSAHRSLVVTFALARAGRYAGATPG